MGADRADLRSLGANHDVTAVAALPDLNLALLKDLLGLHVVQQGAVSLLMGLLNGSNASELGRKSRKALFLGLLGHTVIHIGPLEVLALSSMEKVLSGIAQLAQLLEPKLSVLLLVLGSLQEQLSDLLKAGLLCHGSKVGVLISCLGLACKGLPQVLFCLGSFIFVSHNCILLSGIDLTLLRIPIFLLKIKQKM